MGLSTGKGNVIAATVRREYSKNCDGCTSCQGAAGNKNVRTQIGNQTNVPTEQKGAIVSGSEYI